MTITEWFIFFLIIQVIHFLGTWKLYVKAGRSAWEAAIPIYNGIVLMQIIKRPKWWIILLFIPIINLLMFPVIWVETIRSFGRNSKMDTILVILTLGLYIYYVNYILDVEYIEDRSLHPKSGAGEWISSIVFAIIAATLVHTYFMQPYTIPTSSLEKTLLVGDFLFVSKFHYGARVPMTTVAAPMVHDTIPAIPVPFTGIKLTKKFRSYLNKPQLPYFRIPGFQKIERNDIVVFSWPVDTVEQFFKKTNRRIRKPIDKKSNYVKRCVAIPGDSLEIKGGYIYINGERTKLPDRAKPQYKFYVNTGGQQLSRNMISNRYQVRDGEWGQMQDGNYVINLTDQEAAQLAKNPSVKGITKIIDPKGTDGQVFPNVVSLGWNKDNYGPIYIPEKGKSIKLNKESLPFYKRIITEYEKNNLIVNGDEILINGKDVDSYTFKQNYYWMMGDNRHNSEDARYWGYVPFDHVVGKPVFIWMSWNSSGKGLNKIRWERMFTTVGGSGKPVSYLYYFLGVLGLWFVYDFYRKRKKAK
ncbi:MAG: signal peptidase I [Aureibaculum sp.]|nr:signal peptidase I [Aureibaculum sp.]